MRKPKITEVTAANEARIPERGEGEILLWPS